MFFSKFIDAKGRMKKERGSPTDGDKHKNPERGGRTIDGKQHRN